MLCPRCNGYHQAGSCPKRVHVGRHYYRVLSIGGYARRRRQCARRANADRDDAWQDLDNVHLYCPIAGLLPTSSTPYMGRMFVEAMAAEAAGGEVDA